MPKNNHARLLILVLSVFLAVPSYAKSDDFANSALGKEIINLGLKFLDNPGDFFFNLHSDNEDFSPVIKGRSGALRLNFFPTVFPATWFNLSAKVKVLNEKGYYPQIDLAGMYGDLLALRIAGSSSGDVSPTFNDYSLGAVLSKSVNDKDRIFGGIKYSSVNMDIAFSSPVVLGAFEMSNINFKVSDTFFFTGIMHQSTPQNYFVAQIGYGFSYKKIISRIMLCYRHLELGMDIYPEGLFVIHPFMAWHWLF